MKCQRCGFESPAEMNFCGKCGYELTASSDLSSQTHLLEEKLARIQRYLPESLAKKILAQKGKIEGERKQVTVMFTDMEGFTPLVEKLGPEGAYGFLDQVLEILIHKVHEYEGTVNQMTGDGIMALFGAPIALEDAPQRAIRSAYAIHREMVKFSEKIKQEKGLPPIKMRIGLHTGPVVVGTLGNDLRVEFMAVGDTVNLASRMEGLAEPGTTYVTEDTFKLTEGFFRFESLGEKEVKGKKKPVKLFQVIAPSTRRTRFDVSAEKGLTPFVGREQGLKLLLDGFEQVKESRGQGFSIMGEAGVGKSRLLYEFRKAITNEEVTFLEGKCLSYGRGMIYHPITDILKSNFDIQEGDGDIEVREKVKKGLGVLKVDEASALPYLLELLSVKDTGIDRISMSPEAKKERIIEALKQIALKGSKIRPLVMVIEDLHWVDKSSEDALKYLLESIPGTRVMLIFTYRPEFIHAWGERSYHHQIALGRLSTREVLYMVAHLLGTKEIHKDLEKLILEKTEGVPLFIEELLNSLRDLKIIEKKGSGYLLVQDIKTVAIPSTIQDMIMARVDSLPDVTKTVLQTGSVIEREFSYDLIKSVMGLPEEQLLTHLSFLKDSELLFERGLYPNSTYVSKHALTRDVVYDSILLKTRKQIHHRTGSAIEGLYQDKIHEHFGALVSHFTASEDWRKVADYSRLACKKAEDSMSLHDASDYARKWIVALENLPQGEPLQDEMINARTTLGFCLFRMSDMVEAWQSIHPILDVVSRRGLKEKLAQIYLILGSYKYMAEEEFTESTQYLQKAIEIAAETHEFVTSLYAKYMLGLVLSFNCNFEEAIQCFQMLFSSNMVADRTWLHSFLKSNVSVYAYDYHGMVAQGYQTSEEAVRMAEESGDIYSKAAAYASHGASCYYKGDLRKAEHYLTRGITFTEKINMVAHIALAHQCLGHVYFDLEKYHKAQVHYLRAIHAREQSRLFPSSANLNRIAFMRASLWGGEKGISLDSAYRYVRSNRVRIYEGCMARYLGDILLHLNEFNLAEAESWIGKAVEWDHRNKMRLDLGKDYTLYAQLFQKKGESPRAREFLKKAFGIFKECGADGWVRKIEETLSAL